MTAYNTIFASKNMKNTILLQETTFEKYLFHLNDYSTKIDDFECVKQILNQRLQRINQAFIFDEKVILQIENLNQKLSDLEKELVIEVQNWSKFFENKPINEFASVRIGMETYIKMNNVLYAMNINAIKNMNMKDLISKDIDITQIDTKEKISLPTALTNFPFCFTMCKILSHEYFNYYSWKDILAIEEITGYVEMNQLITKKI